MRPAPLVSILVLALAPAEPAATHHRTRLWATVNVCDTAHHPNTIGIRASMPGTGRAGDEMFMRFQVQYRSGVDHLWHNIGSGADSGYVHVGSSLFKARLSGWRFRFQSRADGHVQVLRGAVTFEWRRRGRSVRHVRRATVAGHPSVVDSDPRGHSSATCRLH